MLSVRTIAVWAVLIVLVGVGVAVWLLLAYTGGDPDANRAQLDAIRTAGTIVVGTGGAAALLLAARRQRSTEIALRQTDREQVTNLYAKAVEQLGSEKAPVRLGGLYALERLAQDNPGQRQTIVNVLCAYLRMPYPLPGDPPADDADDKLITAHRERVQEREVRLAAQRILARHLRPGDDPDSPVDTFWPDTDLDLTGATLLNLSLDSCMVNTGVFDSATFTGRAEFSDVIFIGHAYFAEVTFNGHANFFAATFNDHAYFAEVTFADQANFSMVTFNARASFEKASFADATSFIQATFTNAIGDTYFGAATFTRGVPPEVKRFWSPPDENVADTHTNIDDENAARPTGAAGPNPPSTG